MAPATNKTERDHAVYDRRARPRGPSSAPANDAEPGRFPWKRAAILVLVAAAIVGLIFAAWSLAHWPEAFF